VSRHVSDTLACLVESFFREHLQRVRGASPHTIRAYRDALRLFFAFLADTERRSVADVRLEDLGSERVLAFVTHLESERGNNSTTRNCRLAAVRAFFGHLLRHDPTRAEQYHRVLAIPSKRTRTRPATYLEPADIRVLLRKSDPSTPLGARDHALLLLLYNT
jgi:integrase/recombinase XerD